MTKGLDIMLLVSLSGGLTVPSLLPAQVRMESGKWEIVSTGDVGHVQTRCIGEAEANEVNGPIANVSAALQTKASAMKCNAAHVNIEGDTITWDITCPHAITQTQELISKNRTTYHGNTFEGEMFVTALGLSAERIKGRRLGPCKPCDSQPAAGQRLFYGVPNGDTMQDYLPDLAKPHVGIDLQDLQKQRDAAVYLDLRPNIPMTDLPGSTKIGVGTAHLRDVLIDTQPYYPGRFAQGKNGKYIFDKDGDKTINDGYGGVVGLYGHYTYTRADGTAGVLTAYIEYEHLITSLYRPRDNKGKRLKDVVGCEGFGPQMVKGKSLLAGDVDKHPLVGYLGATQHPHVHVQVMYQDGERKATLQGPWVDPKSILDTDP